MVNAKLTDHARFFDRLVDLVPPKYYHGSNVELVNTKYLKKNAKAAAKQAMKQQHKQNKRAKLDPDTAKTSLQIQQQQANELHQQTEDEDVEAAGPGPQDSAAQSQQAKPAKTLNLPNGTIQAHKSSLPYPCSLQGFVCTQVLHNLGLTCRQSCKQDCRYKARLVYLRVLCSLRVLRVLSSCRLCIEQGNCRCICSKQCMPCRNYERSGTQMINPNRKQTPKARERMLPKQSCPRRAELQLQRKRGA